MTEPDQRAPSGYRPPELFGDPPTRKHTERQPGESYPDALSRVAGERAAAIRDADKLTYRLEAVARLADEMDEVARGLSVEGDAAMTEMADKIRAVLAGQAGEKP